MMSETNEMNGAPRSNPIGFGGGLTALALMIPTLAIVLPALGSAIGSWLGNKNYDTAAALLYQRLKGINPAEFPKDPTLQNLGAAFGWVPDTLVGVMAALRDIAGGRDPNYWPSTSDIVAKINAKFGNKLDVRHLQAFVMKTRSAFVMNANPGSFDYKWLCKMVRSNKEKLIIVGVVGGVGFVGYQYWKHKKGRRALPSKVE